MRFDWERVLKLARLDPEHVIDLLPPDPMRQYRVSGLTVHAVGNQLAQYGDSDGSSIRPGEDRLRLDLETTVKRVELALAVLRAVGLIERTARGNRARQQADRYRLTVPSNLRELVPMRSAVDAVDAPATGPFRS